ncbi:hypothetical protein [Thermococcus sp.]|uniref:hypothetical protein n=1 Tax=Thermococcus sp. TaxID=35749 RepID=UPI00263583B3|nr:hypothetical protein [Thermococcus sp.]
MNWKKPMGLVLYLMGIGLGIARPPLERLACMAIPSGKVLTRVNVPLLTVELALIMLGSLLIGLSHDFKNTHRRNGWLAVSSGLGTAIIAGYAGIESLFPLWRGSGHSRPRCLQPREGHSWRWWR